MDEKTLLKALKIAELLTDSKCAASNPETWTTHGQYIIARSAQAGVFAGNFVSREGDTVTLRNARRLWYWKGAASLSQLAIDGVSCPTECKFAMPVNVVLLGVCEILAVTATAKESIAGVKEWKA